jgi:hypothetical protein
LWKKKENKKTHIWKSGVKDKVKELQPSRPEGVIFTYSIFSQLSLKKNFSFKNHSTKPPKNNEKSRVQKFSEVLHDIYGLDQIHVCKPANNAQIPFLYLDYTCVNNAVDLSLLSNQFVYFQFKRKEL